MLKKKKRVLDSTDKKTNQVSLTNLDIFYWTEANQPPGPHIIFEKYPKFLRTLIDSIVFAWSSKGFFFPNFMTISTLHNFRLAQSSVT